MTNKILLGFTALVVLALIFVMRPVPKVYEDEAIVAKGTVSYVSEGGVKDLIIRLKDDPKVYYINRAMDNGMDVKEMKDKLLGNDVVIKYPEYWSPLDWNSETRHISKLQLGEEVIFNELK